MGEHTMMDFNSTASLSGRVTALIDAGLQARRQREGQRSYLGASRLGVSCGRALQFEFVGAPVDYGRETPGNILRIFERGHVTEDCMTGCRPIVRWPSATTISSRPKSTSRSVRQSAAVKRIATLPKRQPTG